MGAHSSTVKHPCKNCHFILLIFLFTFVILATAQRPAPNWGKGQESQPGAERFEPFCASSCDMCLLPFDNDVCAFSVSLFTCTATGFSYLPSLSAQSRGIWSSRPGNFSTGSPFCLLGIRKNKVAAKSFFFLLTDPFRRHITWLKSSSPNKFR